MTARPRARTGAGGFTLLEVLAGVLVLGILYTVLATAAIQGLGSEGRDRRRAEASLLADRILAELESQLAMGLQLENGTREREEPPYRIAVEVVPEDLVAMLPQEMREQTGLDDPGELATLLVTDQGESRIQRVSVSVSWEEGFETASTERTTYGFDTTGLADLFPAQGEAGADGGTADDADEELTDREKFLRELDRELGGFQAP